VTGGTVLIVALVVVGLYAMTSHGRASGPQAHFVRSHMRDGKRVKAHMRGVGKPSLVLSTVLVALLIAAVALRTLGER
jgi:hypothetical protein